MPGIDFSLEKTAQLFGVDPRTIQRWLRDGCPGTKDAKGRWSLNSAVVSEWLRERERTLVLGEVSDIDEGEARRRKIAAEAALAEFDLAMKTGAAISIDDHGKSMDTAFGNVRAKLLNLGAKIAPLVIGSTNVTETKDLIDGGIREVLAELSNGEVRHNPISDDEPQPEGPGIIPPVSPASRPDGKRVGRRGAKTQSRK